VNFPVLEDLRFLSTKLFQHPKSGVSFEYYPTVPIPEAVRSKAWVCGRSLTRIVGSNPTLSLVSVVCCQVEVSATSWSLVQRSPTDSGVSKKCVIVKRRKMTRPRPQRGCRAIGKKISDGTQYT
jgi:hypothetical protein